MAFGNATKGYVKKHSGGGGGGGTSNYNDLSNKPSINGVTLSGNKTSEDLGISGGGGLAFHTCNQYESEDVLTNIEIPLNASLCVLGICHKDNRVVKIPVVLNTGLLDSIISENGGLILPCPSTTSPYYNLIPLSCTVSKNSTCYKITYNWQSEGGRIKYAVYSN